MKHSCSFSRFLRLSALAAPLAVSCGILPPTQAELAVMDLGPQPSWAKATALGERAILLRLRDSDSAKVSWDRGTHRGYVSWNGTRHFGFQFVAFVNAKNAFGGYTGYKPWVLQFVDGRLDFIGIATDLEYSGWDYTVRCLNQDRYGRWWTPARMGAPECAQYRLASGWLRIRRP